jgi:prepilin-type N-terminal cleavage/methylation domain-containing protein/prepilin-type processing-associated H-X9-DG protein
MRSRRSGFTLIELLVVIAIIGILAAMLFPVFARARESARKIQCLSNVKNIAMAVQMYLTDYDRFWPDAIDAGLGAYMASFGDSGPGGNGDDPTSTCKYAWEGNPYEQVPVVLDEYIKNRDVWRCPSARISWGPIWILGPPRGGGPWWVRLQQDQGKWGADTPYMLCQVPYPPGWGGTVTDSLLQDQTASSRSNTGSAEGVFMSGYSVPRAVWGISTSSMQDSSNWIVLGEYGIRGWMGWPGIVQFAYSDLCKTGLPQIGGPLNGCCNGCVDWENCPDSRNCSYVPAIDFWTDPSIRKNYTRHLGGSNLGFADGHAKWYASEAMLTSKEGCKALTPFNDGTMAVGSPQACGDCCGVSLH